MTDTFEFTLNNPLTEEQWDMIADVDMEHTDKVTFRTKHGKEVEFAKVRHGKWVHLGGAEWCCSACGEIEHTEGSWEHPLKDLEWKYCHTCGARMDT